MSASASFPLQVVISAVDKFARPLLAMQARIDKTFGGLRKLQNSLGGLYQASGLGRVTGAFGEFYSGVAKVGKEVGVLALKLFGMASAAGVAVYTIIQGFAHAGDEAIRIADKLGVPIEAYQELAYAAKQNSVEAATLEGGLKELEKRLGLIKQGNTEAAVGFELLGIHVFDANDKLRGAVDILPEVADRIRSLRDPADATTLAMQVFGKSGADLLPLLRQGSRGIAEARKEARDLGLVLTEKAARSGKSFGDAITRMGGALEGVRNIIGGALAPVLQDLVDKFVAWVVENGPRIEAFARDFAAGLPERLAQIRDFFSELADKMRPLIDIAAAVVDQFGAVNTVLTVLAVVLGAKLVIAIATLLPAIYALGVAILTTPVGWILLGIAALVAIVVLLVKYWEPIGQFFSDLWTTVVDAFSTAFAWVWENVPALLGPVGLIIKYWSSIKAFFVGLWTGIVDVFSMAFAWVWEHMPMLLGPVGLIIKYWSSIKAFFVGLWEGVKATFLSAYVWILGKVAALVDLLPDWIKARLGFEVQLSNGVTTPQVETPRPRGSGPPGTDAGSSSSAKVEVSFKNAPPGARAKAAENDGVDLDLSMGYSMQ